MMTAIKSNKISEKQLFCILFVSRMSALLITGEISVLGFAAQLLCSLVFSAAAYELYLKISLSNKTAKCILRILSVLIAAISFYSVFSFKDSEIPYFLSDAFAVAMICVSVVYSASLGIEAVARLSFLCFIALLAVSILGIFTNLRNVDFKEGVSAEIYGVSFLNIIKCIDTPVLFLSLSDCVNNKEKLKKALYSSVIASYLCTFFLYLMCVLVLRSAVKFYEHPVFALFQLGEIGRYNKLDLIYTSPLLAAVFVKLSSLFARCKNESY